MASKRNLRENICKFPTPLRNDLAIDLYIQIREVERCLDRYPDELREQSGDLLKEWARRFPSKFPECPASDETQSH
jgi:hypothetical protein